MAEQDYLTIDQFSKYVDLSRDRHKIVVVTDRCGSGKSTTRNKFVVDNILLAPRIVVEKKSTCNKIKKELIELGMDEKNIGVYHSGDGGEDIKNLYRFNHTKPIAIITHERLNIDPVSSWIGVKGNVLYNSRLIIVDEVINNMTKIVAISKINLVAQSKEAFPLLGSSLEKALYKNVIFSLNEAVQMIALSEVSILDYSLRMIEKKYSLDLLGIMTNQSDKNLMTLDHTYLRKIKNKSLDPAQMDIGSIRISYQICLVYLAILTGRFKCKDSTILSCAIISPLYSWNAINGVATLILDATGDYNLYPKDLCWIEQPCYPMNKDLISLHKLDGLDHDKRLYNTKSKDNHKLKHHDSVIKIKKLFKLAYTSGDIFYTCTWKEKDSYIDNKIVIQDVCTELKLYTSLDKENDLDKSLFMIDSDEYNILSEELEHKICVYISHFGKSRGENRYSHCNKVLIIGDYYLPKIVYDDYARLLLSEITKEDISRSVFSVTLQEIQRSRERKGKKIEVYIAGSDNVLGLIESELKPNFINIIPLRMDILSTSGYNSLANLTKNQLNKMIKINERYPGFFDNHTIEVTLQDLVDLLEIREDNIERDLNRISMKSSFQYVIRDKLVRMEIPRPL